MSFLVLSELIRMLVALRPSCDDVRVSLPFDILSGSVLTNPTIQS